jgi:beta-1,4-mannosyl-glycoprotein beta-1,4-N-acetylglucosaminyltransferase
MKIFDCTTYFEEDLMMDLRFNILNEYVEKFIVCEATFSHSGNKKKINFDINNFSKFKDKIIHLIVDNDPVKKENIVDELSQSDLRNNSIKRIETQRNYLINGLKDASENDYIIYSDNDEIPNLADFNFQKNKSTIIIFKQKLFYYKFNLAYPKIDWYGSKACKLKNLKSISWLRNIKNKKYKFYRADVLFSKDKFMKLNIVNNGGWHFTNLKTPSELLNKYLNDEMHSEIDLDKTNIENIKDKIKNKYINYNHLADSKSSDSLKQNNKFELTKVDLIVLPEYIRRNFEKYIDWIEI